MDLKKNLINKRLNELRLTDYERQNKKKNLTEDNLAKILLLKNKYKGKRCFIIGGSPSLEQLDLTKLTDEITFSVNRGYKMVDKGLKHTKYHIMADIHSFQDDNIASEIPNDFSDEFLIYGGIDFPDERLKTTYFDFVAHADYIFQDDLQKPLLTRGTVIIFALQIAYYMGFSDIYLIGVDLDFSKIKGHAYKETVGEIERQSGESVKMQDIMLNSIQDCVGFLTSHGVNIYNASPVGRMDCMPRVKYEELF